MRQFISTFTGKHRLRLPDLGFLDSKINEVANGLASPFYYAVLSGCIATHGATTWQLSSGYIILKGEICYCPGGDTGILNNVNINTCYWTVTQTVSPPSPVTYQDGLVHDVHFTRTASLNVANSGYPDYFFMPTIFQAIGAGLQTPWINIGDVNQPNYAAGYSGNLRFTEDLMGWVNLEGTVNAGTLAGSLLIATLLQGYLPDRNIVLPCNMVSGGVETASHIVILTGGFIETAASVDNAEYFISARYRRTA